MRTASVSKLKASLSEYLRYVIKGEEVVVTDHGHPVARISPVIQRPDDPDYLKRLERDGKIRSGTGRLPKDFFETPFAADPEGRFVQAILEEREESR